MIELKREIEREGIIKLMGRSKPFVFKEEWGYNEAERIINYFENCHCCKRHQQFKPNSEDLQSGFVPEYPTKYQNIIYVVVLVDIIVENYVEK